MSHFMCDRKSLKTLIQRLVIKCNVTPVEKWHEIIGDPPMPTPSSTVSYTMPIASISAAKACAAVVQK